MLKSLPKGWYWIGAALLSVALWYLAFLIIGLVACAMRGWR